MSQLKDTLRKIYRKINPITPSQRAQIWNKTTDEEKRYVYDLNEHSVVFDLGGYEGQWTSDIYARYCPTIHVFEPVQLFFNKISKRFRTNKRIFVHQYGLSDANKKVDIFLDANGSSQFIQTGHQIERISLVKAMEFLSEHHINHIDLIKINIEGGEYDLLDHLIASGWVKNISNIQVQFHNFVPDALTRMHDIQNKLALTHHTTYSAPFVWENWKRNTHI